jgi:opacity protein-like surface antigen
MFVRNRNFKLTIVALFLVFSVSLAVQAQEETSPTSMDFFNSRHQVGVRLGVWGNLGDDPPNTDASVSNPWETDFSSANFYIEGFVAYRFSRRLMGEFSLGLVNRGDATFVQFFSGSTQTDVGNLLVYPILLRLKVYPFVGAFGSFQPYVTGGGGIYYARHSIQFTNSGFATFNNSDSETDFNYTLGGGFDYPIASVIGLELNASYFPIQFSNELATIDDYSGLQVTVGIKYLFDSTK